jgi:hypothetical protein
MSVVILRHKAEVTRRTQLDGQVGRPLVVQLRRWLYPKSTWKLIGNKWYYFDADGWMVTGWVHTAGKWYFCDKTKGSTEGQMLESTIINDGGYFYALGKDGAMITTSVNASQDHDGHFGHLILP